MINIDNTHNSYVDEKNTNFFHPSSYVDIVKQELRRIKMRVIVLLSLNEGIKGCLFNRNVSVKEDDFMIPPACMLTKAKLRKNKRTISQGPSTIYFMIIVLLFGPPHLSQAQTQPATDTLSLQPIPSPAKVK